MTTLTVLGMVLLFLLLVSMAGAAPTPTARTTPTGIKLKNGYRSLFTFSLDPDAAIWEVSITLGGGDVGEPIDQTTMWNDDYMTMSPQELVRTGDTNITGAYDPILISQLETMKGIEQVGTLTWKDGSTLANYGWINSWTFAELVNGTQPRITVVWINSNYDFTNNVEAGPALAEVAGT